MAVRADAPVKLLGAKVSKLNLLTIESVDFYYRLEEKAKYLTLKSEYQSRTRGEISPQVNEALAQKAYEASNTDKIFTRWRYHGGPSPNVFSIKAHLYNQDNDVKINLPLHVTIRAQMGELLVNPQVLIVDYKYLRQTAQWRIVDEETVTVPVVAPGEDMLVQLKEVNLLAFLNNHPAQWPLKLEVKVTCPKITKAAVTTVELTPDHFNVPVLY